MAIPVLYVITDLNIGGTEKMLYETVIRLDKARYMPVVCSLKETGYYAEQLAKNGIEVIGFRTGNSLLSVLKLIIVIFKLSGVIYKRKVRIVHTYLTRANVIGRLAVLIVKLFSSEKIKVISSVRVIEQEKKYHILFEKLTSNISDRFIVNSNALKEFVVREMKFDSAKVNVVYNGIDLSNLPVADIDKKRMELGLSHGDTAICAIGRLHKQKGMEYLIKAASLTGKMLPDISLKYIIVGDGPEKKELQKLIYELNLLNNVILAGWKTDILEIISAIDILVLPSLWEGTPNVILEAMAYNKPVIATAVGGVPEIINDRETGILVNPGNPEELAEKIVYLVKNNQIAEGLAAKGKESVKKYFSISTMVRETETIYQELTNKNYHENTKYGSFTNH